MLIGIEHIQQFQNGSRFDGELDDEALYNNVVVVLCINQTGTKYQVYTQPQIWTWK